MFGCLRRFGCLVILIVACAAAFLMRDYWWPQLRERFGGGGRETTVATAVWQPVSDSGAQKAGRAIESLGRKSGPVFTNIQAGELASYVLVQLTRQLPPSARDLEAAVIGNQVHVRANVDIADLGKNALGPLAGILGNREPVEFGGTFSVIRPGLAEFAVQELKIRELNVPQGAIARVMRQVDRGAKRDSVAANAFALDIPPYIGDIRVGRGRVTIYKNVP